MNRENKKRQYDRHYYQTHPCTDSFTCKHCGRLVVSAGAGTGHRNHCPNCLTSLHLDVEPGDRSIRIGAGAVLGGASSGRGAGRPVGGPRRAHGAHRRLGTKGRRVGHHPPVPPVRGARLQPDGGGRQPRQADVHRPQTPDSAALPHRADGGAGQRAGDGQQHGVIHRNSAGRHPARRAHNVRPYGGIHRRMAGRGLAPAASPDNISIERRNDRWN